MSGFYHHHLPSPSGAEDSPNQSPQDTHYFPQQTSPHHDQTGAPVPNPYPSLGYFTGFPDPIVFQAPKPSGVRRKKSTFSLDHVKHRRTRSGCYTCRTRRVKCDETHPICERCRKGKRDCVYPEPTGAKGIGSAGSAKDTAAQSQGASPTSSQDDPEAEADRDPKLEPIIDEDETIDPVLKPTKSFSQLRRSNTLSSLNLRRSSTRHSSETPSLEGTKSSSPSISTGTTTSFATPFHMSDFGVHSITSRPDWSHLPMELQSHLNYFCENITHHHYAMVVDVDNFFQTILPSIAVQRGNDPLLYAVVGFSAYHRTVHNPNGQIQDFLQYYNKSVTLLLNCLKRGETQTLSTLLTMLQLATIEEYLGDFVNLMGHQKAAMEILTRLFTPQNTQRLPQGRMTFTWYVRFDIFVGMIGGFKTTLPREWLVAAVQFSQGQVETNKTGIDWATEFHASALRLISWDMTILYARAGCGELEGDDFRTEHDRITEELYSWRNNMSPSLTDPVFLITDFQPIQSRSDEMVVDPYKPGLLYDFPLFSTTLLLAEWNSIIIMHKSQEGLTLQQEPSEELRNIAFSICETYEAVQFWPSAPNGALITIQPSLGMACLFMPREEKYDMWMRRKFATTEGLGYTFPIAVRARMAELFRDSSCRQWWLPDDEGLSPTLRSIRNFADERNANPTSEKTESLREISAIFAKMNIDTDENISPVDRTNPGPFSRGKGKHT